MPLLKPLTLPLTFVLTFTLNLHPELLHFSQRQRRSKISGVLTVPSFMPFSAFDHFSIPFVRQTLNFRLPSDAVQNPPVALSGCELPFSRMRPSSYSGPIFTVIIVGG